MIPEPLIPINKRYFREAARAAGLLVVILKLLEFKAHTG
jgi:hypothetical protein